MKTKKNIGKQKKKKPGKETSDSGGIFKAKNVKNVKKKIRGNDAVLETLKRDLHEQGDIKKQIPNRQLVWNSYLKTFTEMERLNKKQKQIMEFCTNKSRTPPKRKRKFLNFIRHCFPSQADVTDEQINELFDLLLKKYDDFKSGQYCATKFDANCEHETKPKMSVNKKKKLKRTAAKAFLQSSNVNAEEEGKQTEKVKLKKKKRAKFGELKDREQNDD